MVPMKRINIISFRKPPTWQRSLDADDVSAAAASVVASRLNEGGMKTVWRWIMQVCLVLLCRRLSIKSVVTFADPSEEDLGLYTVEISDNPNLSSSYDFTAEGQYVEGSLLSLAPGSVSRKKYWQGQQKMNKWELFDFKAYQAFLSSN